MNHFRPLSARLVLILAICAFATQLHASPGQEMADAANNFLAALTPEQQAKATYAFQDDERFDWHFIPKPRKGLPFKEMTSGQQKLADALLDSGLSQRGYAKAVTIMSLDDILKEMEKDTTGRRDPNGYYFTIFGKPGPDTWGWRVEGHHLSLNYVVRGDQVLAATPAFFGANPAEVKDGPRKGLRVLGEEETLGRAFVKSLTEAQQKVAILMMEAPKEMITTNARKAQLLNPPGLPASELTGEQKESLRNLLKNYAYRHRAELAEDDLKKIDAAGFDKVHFAWVGSTEPGEPHYYRVQGPTFLLEYDDVQNNANHIHTVWRDLANDFGDDVLLRHYQEVPHDK
jgi:Protein of unknown function (DUF3500)